MHCDQGINTNQTCVQKRCPVWNHECYAECCQAWDSDLNECSILNCMKYLPVYRQFPIHEEHHDYNKPLYWS